jgi:hypothetical protein
MMLASRAIAVQGIGFGPKLMAVQGFGSLQNVVDHAGGFDAPYQAYVKRINAQRAQDAERSVEPVRENDVAISESEEYDLRVGRSAPQRGASPILQDVAPVLNQASQSIRITQQTLRSITSSAALQARQRQDEEAAMLALFVLMIDD